MYVKNAVKHVISFRKSTLIFLARALWDIHKVSMCCVSFTAVRKLMLLIF